MSPFVLSPIATVRSPRSQPLDDDWDSVVCEVELVPTLDEECLAGLADFSHVELVYLFDRVDEADIVYRARHPRNNPDWPKVGIFAQRGKNRPNRLGVSVAPLIEVRGRVLRLRGLDAIDGTPVLDIKPVMREFLPRGELRQPTWATELMREYWSRPAR
ncbi:MAG: SAM-dependent methyltransferase [Polyangia bacterium]